MFLFSYNVIIMKDSPEFLLKEMDVKSKLFKSYHDINRTLQMQTLQCRQDSTQDLEPSSIGLLPSQLREDHCFHECIEISSRVRIRIPGLMSNVTVQFLRVDSSVTFVPIFAPSTSCLYDGLTLNIVVCPCGC